MDRKSKLLLLVLSVVLFVHSDAATTVSSSSTGITSVLGTTSKAPSIKASSTVPTLPAPTVKPFPINNFALTTSNILDIAREAGCGQWMKHIDAEAPVSCNTGTCIGVVCTNISTTYTPSNCTTGECVTEKTTKKITDTYTFRCANTNCAADKSAAPNGTTIFCCDHANCNTYAALNSAASLCNLKIALCTGLVLLLKLF